MTSKTIQIRNDGDGVTIICKAENIMDLDELYLCKTKAGNQEHKVNKIILKMPSELFSIPCEYI